MRKLLFLIFFFLNGQFEIEIDLITMGRLEVEKKRDLSAKIKAFFTSIIDYKIKYLQKFFLKILYSNFIKLSIITKQQKTFLKRDIYF